MTSNRIRELDGLRGLAALIVLAHHIFLTFPAFAAPYFEGSVSEEPWVYALTYTPLHAVWEGQSAVYVFFILSGVVLTLPVLSRGKSYAWLTYYPQRLVRLYLPVWVAVLVGIVGVTLVARTAQMDSAWLQARSVEATFGRIIRDLTLLGGHGGLVSPLWSLRWEILFSILLPAFIWVGVRFARWRWVILAISFVTIGIGATFDVLALWYLPMFMIGVIIAVSLDDVRSWGSRLGKLPAWMLTLLAPVLLVTPWLVRPLGTSWASGALECFAVLGALIAVVAAITVGPMRKVLLSRFFQWAGLISFSLYLVHEPVVISMAFLFGDDRLMMAALISIPASLLLAVIFYRFIERPSHLAARRIGSAIDRRRATTGHS